MVLAEMALSTTLKMESVDGMQRAQRRYPSRSEDQVSTIDRQIIHRLQADGRRPYTQIAAELGMSEAAVRARVNRLMNDGVLHIVAVVDPQRLGYGLLATIGVNCDAARLLDIADELAALPEAVRVVVTAGTFDLLVEAACADHEALLELVSQRLGTIEGVQAMSTFVYLRVAKQTHQWQGPG
jgi:Lrp/AsnC family transcriptional regulator, regulator for asnA, asnC and gidA